jgi:hypothetical protein
MKFNTDHLLLSIFYDYLAIIINFVIIRTTTSQTPQLDHLQHLLQYHLPQIQIRLNKMRQHDQQHQPLQHQQSHQRVEQLTAPVLLYDLLFVEQHAHGSDC